MGDDAGLGPAVCSPDGLGLGPEDGGGVASGLAECVGASVVVGVGEADTWPGEGAPALGGGVGFGTGPVHARHSTVQIAEAKGPARRRASAPSDDMDSI